jgi:hypothetical protein
VSAYGVIDPSGPLDEHGVVRIRTMVEKPPVAEAPSDLIIIGRYVLTPDVFDKIGRVQPGAGGEIQLTDALRMQAAEGPVPRCAQRHPPLRHRQPARLADGRGGARARRRAHRRTDFRAWLRGRV